ncbi:MAG: FKBP-type peptidyl-prolyl cis-trans isomerase [Myxococcota bacterium]|jgi:FKBP-type peptidyl-prolyl cis-trans isomerase 2|nr:FKBP-type peptidyl-prolyl cis-trans isomerase [Myxococcota bacterium]
MPEDGNRPLAEARLEHIARHAHGNLIAFEFTVFGEAGEELGGNVGENPRIFQVGAGEMLPAVERALVDLAAGECRSIVLSPEQAYGPIRDEAFREFPLDSIPEEARQVGRKVMGRGPDGSEDMFDIVAIRDDKVVIDMNHPLAGRTLRFELKVLHNNPCQG